MSIETFMNTLNSNHPDFVYEEFWLLFKASVINARDKGEVYKDYADNKVVTTSEILNNLREAMDKDWIINICNTIETFLVDYGYTILIDVQEYDNLFYYKNILCTNIKRWIKLNNNDVSAELRLINILLWDKHKFNKDAVNKLVELKCKSPELIIVSLIPYLSSHPGTINRMLADAEFRPTTIVALNDAFNLNINNTIKNVSRLLKTVNDC